MSTDQIVLNSIIELDFYCGLFSYQSIHSLVCHISTEDFMLRCANIVGLSGINITITAKWNDHKDIIIHWGRVTHICVSKLTIISSDNGLSHRRRQAIIWTNSGILLIGPFGTNFSEILVGIQTFRSEKCTWKCRLCYSVHFVSASMS